MSRGERASATHRGSMALCMLVLGVVACKTIPYARAGQATVRGPIRSGNKKPEVDVIAVKHGTGERHPGEIKGGWYYIRDIPSEGKYDVAVYPAGNYGLKCAAIDLAPSDNKVLPFELEVTKTITLGVVVVPDAKRPLEPQRIAIQCEDDCEILPQKSDEGTPNCRAGCYEFGEVAVPRVYNLIWGNKSLKFNTGNFAKSDALIMLLYADGRKSEFKTGRSTDLPITGDFNSRLSAQ